MPLDAMAGIDTNRGAKRARELRAELGMPADRPLDCLLTLVEQRLGIAVVFAVLPAGLSIRIVQWLGYAGPRD